ncbi:ESX secretion-associated protein EspG [Amycolatopsis aidingensis]|uniref:ESX secretion-associated protein EspG n=1 Tax=Amycolatopsis aidingensis TaxID=2842453 RepID=UPI001C0BE4DE|nr:ESX secretion-associated protein EspG [Amycolatopsis aidingensis]
MTITAEPATGHGVPFGLAELDLLSTYAGRPLPFPLRVPSCGRTEDERNGLLAAAGRTLAERGLATGHGPSGAASDLVTVLCEHRNAIDLVVVAGGTVAGVVAMLHEQRAVVCRQSIGGAPGPVTVATVPAAALTAQFTKQIPSVAAAPAMPVTLPPGVVGAVAGLLRSTAGIASPWKRIRTLVRERGGGDGAVDALVNLLPSVTGRGQLGAVTLPAGDGPVERSFELSWLDSSKGRVRVDNDADGWVSINPLRQDELVQLLRAAAAPAGGQSTR